MLRYTNTVAESNARGGSSAEDLKKNGDFKSKSQDVEEIDVEIDTAFEGVGRERIGVAHGMQVLVPWTDGVFRRLVSQIVGCGGAVVAREYATVAGWRSYGGF